jgi:hypothetical protein
MGRSKWIYPIEYLGILMLKWPLGQKLPCQPTGVVSAKNGNNDRESCNNQNWLCLPKSAFQSHPMIFCSTSLTGIAANLADDELYH